MAVVTRQTLDGDWIQFDGATVTIFPDMNGGWSQQEVAAATIPTLTLPGVIDITATSARPQVTLTY